MVNFEKVIKLLEEGKLVKRYNWEIYKLKEQEVKNGRK